MRPPRVVSCRRLRVQGSLLGGGLGERYLPPLPVARARASTGLVPGRYPADHEFLSLMLAVRQPSVTTSLHVLEGNGFIRNERGWITICNRKALEEFAHDAYGKPEAEYRRLIGPMTAP